MDRRTFIRRGGAFAAVAGLTLTGIARNTGTARAGGGVGLLVIGDTVWAGANVSPEEAPFLACVQANRFPQGAGITFRMKVIDPATGQALTGDEATMTLTLPDGTVQTFNYHPLNRGMSPESAFLAAWPIPEDYPTGALDVVVQAVDRQGRTGTWQQFNAPTSLLQIVPKGQR